MTFHLRGIVLSRNTQKVAMGICIRCNCSRDEGNENFWCLPCQKIMKESHTKRFSEND